MTRLRPTLACLVSMALAGAPVSSLAHEPAAVPQPSAASLTGEAAGAAAVVDAFHAALKAGDTNKAAGLLDENMLVFEGGGAERSRTEYAASHLKADAAFVKTATETVSRRTGGAGGGLAWIASEGRLRATSPRAVDLLTTETMVLRNTPAGWRIVHVHWSSRAADAAH